MRIQGLRRFAPSMALAFACSLALSVSTSNASHCGGDHSHDTMKKAHSTAQPDIVDTAVSAGDFSTLVAAIEAAGLLEALRGDGPFTVFAPKDAAFAKLPKSAVEDLLLPENRDALSAILTYHVVPGRVTSDAASKLAFATTLNGQRVALAVQDGRLSIGGAKIVAADIETSNGVIHVIDTVLMPAQDDILGTATNAGSFKTLAKAIKAAGLVEALEGEGPFTVFAPTDAAFASLPKGTLEDLLKPENRSKLVSVLKYHVVAGRVYSDQALKAGHATTLQKGKIKVSSKAGAALVNDAKLLQTDIEATNGVIHVIDQVLIPTDRMAASK